MNLKKRTKGEIAYSVHCKDYTGGYKFLPWLIYMRTWYFVYVAISLFGIYSALRDGFNWIFLFPAGLIFLVLILLKKIDYDKRKKGIVK